MGRRALLALPCALAILAANGSAATYIVRPDGTGDYPTIQAAVDNALAGDEILLADGVFRGDGNRDIFCGTPVTIRSLHGDPTACVIDCEGSAEEHHQAFLLVDTALIGVTVTHGYNGQGGAIALRQGSPVIGCIFVENHSPNEGGAIYADGYSMEISECTFIRNSARYLGGAAFI